MWIWFAAGVGVLTPAVVVAFARVLGSIGSEVAELQDTIMWADWPTSPERVSVREPEQADVPVLEAASRA